MSAMLPAQDFATLVALGPLVSIDLVVQQGSRYLFGYRKNRPAQNFWFVPGGRILKNESIQVALKRLTQTELGIGPEQLTAEPRFKGVYEHFYKDAFCGPNHSTHYVVLAYQLQVKENQVVLDSSQHGDICWLTAAQIQNNPDIHEHSRAYFA